MVRFFTPYRQPVEIVNMAEHKQPGLEEPDPAVLPAGVAQVAPQEATEERFFGNRSVAKLVEKALHEREQDEPKEVRPKGDHAVRHADLGGYREQQHCRRQDAGHHTYPEPAPPPRAVFTKQRVGNDDPDQHYQRCSPHDQRGRVREGHGKLPHRSRPHQEQYERLERFENQDDPHRQRTDVVLAQPVVLPPDQEQGQQVRASFVHGTQPDRRIFQQPSAQPEHNQTQDQQQPDCRGGNPIAVFYRQEDLIVCCQGISPLMS